MAEPEDAVLPILRSIQDRLGSMERRMDSNFTEVKEKLLDHDEAFESIKSLMTFHLGMTTEQSHRLETIEAEMEILRKRVTALETRS